MCQFGKISFLDEASSVNSCAARRRIKCNELLSALSLGDLRFHVVERLGLVEVEVVWFDVFHRRMSDEVEVKNVGSSLNL